MSRAKKVLRLVEYERLSVNKTTHQDVAGHHVATGSHDDIDNGKRYDTSVYWDDDVDYEVVRTYTNAADAEIGHDEVVGRLKDGSFRKGMKWS
jgi:hypothetical protein